MGDINNPISSPIEKEREFFFSSPSVMACRILLWAKFYTARNGYWLVGDAFFLPSPLFWFILMDSEGGFRVFKKRKRRKGREALSCQYSYTPLNQFRDVRRRTQIVSHSGTQKFPGKTIYHDARIERGCTSCTTVHHNHCFLLKIIFSAHAYISIEWKTNISLVIVNLIYLWLIKEMERRDLSSVHHQQLRGPVILIWKTWWEEGGGDSLMICVRTGPRSV